MGKQNADWEAKRKANERQSAGGNGARIEAYNRIDSDLSDGNRIADAIVVHVRSSLLRSAVTRKT